MYLLALYSFACLGKYILNNMIISSIVDKRDCHMCSLEVSDYTRVVCFTLWLWWYFRKLGTGNWKKCATPLYEIFTFSDVYLV